MSVSTYLNEFPPSYVSFSGFWEMATIIGRARTNTIDEQIRLPLNQPPPTNMSLRIVPENNPSASISSTAHGEAAPHAPGLQDILRTQEGPLNLASKINNRHPLEGRIANWEQTQQDTRFEIYRRVFGAGEPIKRTMELEIVNASDFKPSVLGGSDNMHRDILLNKDTSVDWEDVYRGGFDSGNQVQDFHSEMEKRMGL